MSLGRLWSMGHYETNTCNYKSFQQKLGFWWIAIVTTLHVHVSIIYSNTDILLIRKSCQILIFFLMIRFEKKIIHREPKSFFFINQPWMALRSVYLILQVSEWTVATRNVIQNYNVIKFNDYISCYYIYSWYRRKM